MDYGVFENELTTRDKVPKGQEDMRIVKACRVSSAVNTLQHSVLDKARFILSIGESDTTGSSEVEFASSNRIEPGRYEIYQKWINPYGKSENYFFYPSPTNPLGKYLIILRSLDSGLVTPYGIHQWFNWDGTDSKFQKGFVNNRGCIRIRREEIEQVFHSLHLRSQIQVI